MDFLEPWLSFPICRVGWYSFCDLVGSFCCLQNSSVILRWKERKKRKGPMLPEVNGSSQWETKVSACLAKRPLRGEAWRRNEASCRKSGCWVADLEVIICWHQGLFYSVFSKGRWIPWSLLLRPSLFLFLIQMVSIYTKPIIKNLCTP